MTRSDILQRIALMREQAWDAIGVAGDIVLAEAETAYSKARVAIADRVKRVKRDRDLRSGDAFRMSRATIDALLEQTHGYAQRKHDSVAN